MKNSLHYRYCMLLLATIPLYGVHFSWPFSRIPEKERLLPYRFDASANLFKLVINKQLTEERCDELLQLGANINAIHYCIDGKKTVLLLAVEQEEYEIAQILIKKGAHVNYQDNNGHTPLMAAVDAQRIDLVKLLLKSGAKIEVQKPLSTQCSSALHQAVAINHCEIAQFLITSGGANLNAKTDDPIGKTPMYKLILDINEHQKHDYTNMANVLLEHGIDLLVESRPKITVFDLLLYELSNTRRSSLSPKIKDIYELIMQWCLIQVYDSYIVPLRLMPLGKLLPRDIIKYHILVYLIGSNAVHFKPSKPLSIKPPFLEKKLLALKKSQPNYNAVIATACIGYVSSSLLHK